MTWTAKQDSFTTLCTILDGNRVVAENVGKGDAERIVNNANLSTEFIAMMNRSLDQYESEQRMRAAMHEASRSMFSAEYYAHMREPIDIDPYRQHTGSDE